MQQHLRREAIQNMDQQLKSSEKAERARLQACISMLDLLLFDGANAACINLSMYGSKLNVRMHSNKLLPTSLGYGKMFIDTFRLRFLTARCIACSLSAINLCRQLRVFCRNRMACGSRKDNLGCRCYALLPL